MKRALAALTVAAFLTLVIDVAGGHRSAASLVPGAAFVLARHRSASPGWTGGGRAGRRTRTWSCCSCSVYAVFARRRPRSAPTLLLVVLVSQSVLLLPLPAVVVVVALVAVRARRHVAVATGCAKGWACSPRPRSPPS